MASIAGLILAMIILVDCLSGGHLGLINSLFCLLRNRHSRWFIIAGIVCAGSNALMLLTGILSVGELIDQERLFFELCPLCA